MDNGASEHGDPGKSREAVSAADQSDKVLRLDIGIEGVPLQRLIQAQVNFLGLLREVSSSVVGDSDDVRWIVTEVRAESVDLLVRPVSARDQLPTSALEEIPAVVEAGINAIERRAVRPRHFSDEALGYARELARLRGRGITSLAVRRNGAATRITERTVANVTEVIGRMITAIGTVEGTLETITVRGRRSFYVYDPLTGTKIDCDFGHRIDISAVAAAIERRVAVTGELRYRENGELMRVRAETIFVFPSNESLPRAQEVRGVLAD